MDSNLQFVPSVLQGNYRIRAVYNEVYQRPIEETFHQFLVEYVKYIFGEDWLSKQKGMERDRRNKVANWCEDILEFMHRNQLESNLANTENIYVADSSGPAWALLTLGYDLFCLHSQNKLTESIINRLKKNISFQSARYEVLVTALMMKNGFDINFLEQDSSGLKSCEFIAVDKNSKIEIGVEAKSRIRTENNEIYESGRDSKALLRLIKKANKQKVKDIPFLIFVDVNTVLTPDTPLPMKSWHKDIKKAISNLDVPTPDKPAIPSAIVVTNFAFSLEQPYKTTSKPEHCIFFPPFSKDPVPSNKWLHDFNKSLSNYALIPSEV